MEDALPTDGFGRATIDVATDMGPVGVDAIVKGGLAVHPSLHEEDGEYTVTHTGAGAVVGRFPTQAHAIGFVIAALEVADWERDPLPVLRSACRSRSLMNEHGALPPGRGPFITAATALRGGARVFGVES